MPPTVQTCQFYSTIRVDAAAMLSGPYEALCAGTIATWTYGRFAST